MPGTSKGLLSGCNCECPDVFTCAYMLSRFSHAQLIATLWTVAHQASLSMGFSRQEYWSAFPCPPSGDLPDPGIEPVSLVSPALAAGFFHIRATLEAQKVVVQFSSVQLLSRVLLFMTPWNTAHQASLCITNPQSVLTHVH